MRDACEYALTNGGKRFRPLVVFLVADALKLGMVVSEAALSVEYLHTASLIADDLPCMDNESERRKKPALHKVFGESVALLASYSLVTAGFGKIPLACQRLRDAGPPFSTTSDHICTIALACGSEAAGILGATGGQFLDLFPPKYSLETIKHIICRKAVALFEISFFFGWLFGGGELSLAEKARKLGSHFGMAFQIADDIQDVEEDEKRERTMNIARFLGGERALSLFEEEMSLFEKGLAELNLLSPSFEKMAVLLRQYARN